MRLVGGLGISACHVDCASGIEELAQLAWHGRYSVGTAVVCRAVGRLSASDMPLVPKSDALCWIVEGCRWHMPQGSSITEWVGRSGAARPCSAVQHQLSTVSTGTALVGAVTHTGSAAASVPRVVIAGRAFALLLPYCRVPCLLVVDLRAVVEHIQVNLVSSYLSADARHTGARSGPIDSDAEFGGPQWKGITRSKSIWSRSCLIFEYE